MPIRHLALTAILLAATAAACSGPRSRPDVNSYFQAAAGSCPRYYFESPTLTGSSVPECPADTGNVILPRTYPPRAIFIGFSQHPIHVDFMNQLIETVHDRGIGVKVNILIPRYETEAAYNLLRRFVEDEPYSSYVNFLSTPSDETLWTQDYFETAISMHTGKASVIDLPYTDREGELIPSSIALSCHMNLITQPPFDLLSEDPGNGDYGGNIEAYPGNIVVVGDNMTSATRKSLAENLRQQELFTVEVKWLETGHVDELFSAVPVPAEGDGACAFAVTRASPKLALDLLANAEYHADIHGLQPPLPEDADLEAIAARTDFSGCYPALSKSGGKSVRESRLCREFRRANLKYEEIIMKAMDRLMVKIRAKTKCQNVKVIDLPLLFAPEKPQKEYGLETDLAQAVNASTVNNISLGPLLILPRQSYEPFQRRILEQLAPTGLDLLFIDGSYVHYLSGGIHCISNVVHSCRQKR